MTQRFGAFSNPIVGGDGVLIRESIRSPNYVPGVSGWTINKDGTASFNSTTINGDLKVVGADGSIVWIREFNSAAVIQLYPPLPDPDLHQAEIVSVIEYPMYPTLLVLGPYYDNDPANEPADLHLRSDPTGSIAELHAKIMGIGPYDLASPLRPGSYISVFPEKVFFLTDVIVTGNKLLNSVNGLETGAQVGMEDGKWYESNAAGVAVTTERFVANTTITTASTAYVENTAQPTEGVVFRHPASGWVRIDWAGGIANSGAGAGYLSWEIRLGNTVGSGTIVFTATDNRAVENPGTRRQASSFLDAQLPGNSNSIYNLRLMYRVDSGTGTFTSRRVSVTPHPY